MHKVFKQSKRQKEQRKRRAGILPKWVSEKITIPDQIPRLNKQYQLLQGINLRPKYLSARRDKVTPRPRPSRNNRKRRHSSGCDEPVLGPDPNPGLGCDEPGLDPDPNPVLGLDTLKPSGEEPTKEPIKTADCLKYLGLFEDISYRSKLVPSRLERVHKVLGKISWNQTLGIEETRILPEEVMKTFPEESSDLQTVTIGKIPQVSRARRRKATKYHALLYQPCSMSDSKKPYDLFTGETLVVVVRVYWPYREKPQYIHRRYPPKPSQVIVMLGTQTLAQLRDVIRCNADIIIPRECSRNPGAVTGAPAKDVYKSGFIFIGDKFYNDFRDPHNMDYSKVIRTWLEGKGVGHFDSFSMERTKIQDLTVQLGRAYVYQHQGSCEHLVVISDIRLLSREESHCMSDYPWVAYAARRKCKLCYLCGRRPSCWMIRDNIRFIYNPCYLCEKCFLSFNYVDGKKVGEFLAYKFTAPFFYS